VLRDDEVGGSISREEALKNAPEHDEQFFKVPKVIRKVSGEKQ
jgi:aspartyl-tRNA(Asn)/glutamyl-tRNA(Gln) amidotransferase subunit C